ncbi:hypothetical protein ACJMK2_034245 [Sinanodonta woodiana]|uniref:Uncharacterized protein n=1 Tax=Sinanodonta woodiana TaxID=1069815 RepID=A0ABD3WQY8_SINWO
MLFYMLVFGLVKMVSGETCCVPNAMEGVAGMVVSTIVDGMPYLVKARAMVHLNFTLGMMEIEAEMSVNGQESNITIINDYINKIQYAIMNGSCTKFALKGRMPQCIPENATLVEETFVGAGTEKVAVKTYTFMIANIEIFFTVTSSGCVPIIMEISPPMAPKRIPGVGMEVLNFSGITLGNISTGHLPVLSRLGRYVFSLTKIIQG